MAQPPSSRLKQVDPRTAVGRQKEIIDHLTAQYGFLPGISRLLLADPEVHAHVGALYRYLQLRPGSPLSRTEREMLATVVNGLVGGAAGLGLHAAAVRRLTGDERLGADFATTWRGRDLNGKTRALLEYAEKLTSVPARIEARDIEALGAAGWDADGIYEATLLVALFNFSGRMEAAAGLPMEEMPASARPPETIPDP
jgi:uncharacterized peroxidase-related enzyme